MAFLDALKINGEEKEATKYRANRRIRFLVACAEKADLLSELFDKGPDKLPSPIGEQSLEKIGQLGEAAQIAFCTEDTNAGLALLKLSLQFSLDLDALSDPMEIARQSLFVGLIRPAGDLRLPAPEEATGGWSMARQVKALPIQRMAEVLLTEPQRNFRPLGFRGEGNGRLAMVERSVSHAPEFTVISRVDGVADGSRFQNQVLGDPELSLALLDMEMDYSRRIDVMARDIIHWKALRLRADIIDWSLLAALVALLRRNFNLPPIGDSSVIFIRQLAQEIANGSTAE